MIGATLTTRLAQDGITKSTVTTFALAFLVYNFKFLWAWIVDGVRLPILGRLGQRVSWLIFAGLPLVTLRNDHVTVDLLDAFIPDWLFRIQHVVICLICFAATAYLAWRLGVHAVAMDRAGETTAQLKFKLAYLTYAMSLLMALTALTLLVLAVRRPRRHQLLPA